MTLTRLACSLLLIAACGTSDSKPSPKPVEETVAKTEPVKQPAKAKPPVSAAGMEPEATSQDLEYEGKIDDSMKVAFKPAPETFIDMKLEPRVRDGLQVLDVVSAGKVIDTIETGVEKDAFGMEVKAQIGAMREGVLAVVHVGKTTGKPADWYKGRVYDWNGSAMKLKRKFQHEMVYDPEQHGL